MVSTDGDALSPPTPPSPPSNVTSRMTADAQARLDDEIAVLTLKLCNLRGQRNTLSPVSRVPPEVLASIFIHCACPHQQPRHIGSGVPDWVNVSYVCRHWRDVALHCPTLWSFLFVSSQQWTDELLARSKVAPLTVCVDSEYPKQSKELNLLKRAAPQADRIQDLSLRLTRREAERILSLFSSPAPLLQRLWISVERSNYLGEPALNLTGALFDGDTPSLRNLELINYAFPLTSPSLCGLTSLRLRDLNTSIQPTLAELKAALSRMPHLVQLHLENALPSAHANSVNQSFESPGTLRFPQLSRLSVIAPLSTVVLLLSRFVFSLQTEIRLRCCYEAGVEDYTPIYPLLAQRFVAPEDQGLAPIIRTCFVETSSATVSFIFSTAERDSERRAYSGAATAYELGQLHEDWDDTIPLKVDVVLPTSLSRDRENLIGGVCHSMPLTNLSSVHINFDVVTALSSDFWRGSFGHLEMLWHVKLSEVNLLGLVPVLSLHPHGEGGGLGLGSGQIFAPALKELELYSVDFAKECRARGMKSTCACSVAMACLYDALASRQAAGYGLQRLVFAECMYIRDYHVEGLRESVTDFDWDGLGGSEREELHGGPFGRFG